MSIRNQDTTGNGYYPLPSHPDLERLVLGAIQTSDPDTVAVWSQLGVTDFTLDAHRIIYRRMLALHRRGEPVDRVTIAQELHDHGELERIGGLGYLLDLDEGLPRPAHSAHYIDILRATSLRCRMVHLGDEFMHKAADPTLDPARLLSEHRERLAGMEQSSASARDLMVDLPLLANHEINTNYLVEDLIAENSVTLWTGGYGDGKSTLALALAAAVAKGELFLGRATLRRPVLILDRENGIDCLKERMMRMQISDAHCALRVWGVWGDKRQRPPVGPESAEIMECARKYKPLLIFDSLVAFAGCDENNSSEMRAHLNWYRRLAAAGASPLILHHASEKTPSARNYRGSTDIPGAVDSAWLLSRDDKTTASESLGRLVLTPFKTRISPGKAVRIEYREGAFLPVDAPPRPPLDIVKELLRSYPGAAQKELKRLAQKHGLAERRLVETLDAAVLARTIDARRGKHNTLRYYLPEAGLGASV